MSAFMVVISVVMDFNISITSAMVGSLMAAGCGAEAVEDCGDGGGLGRTGSCGRKLSGIPTRVGVASSRVIHGIHPSKIGDNVNNTADYPDSPVGHCCAECTARTPVGHCCAECTASQG
ncbi:hypothetical protein E2562_029640 [Oryza meyeriana var. granulata]|uniref:Secreted protein n=1 Tax=Oryza meyeriana var. granulata TaxID=110450 RepID=A0A6G1FE28_9ORYZ|nr:hypothetical protein E2562_029640 [Oryza meyeriana var. granulata]